MSKFLVLAILATLVAASGVFISPARAASTPVLKDNFNTNTINSTLWQQRVTGAGPSVVAANQRLEVSLPRDSVNDPTSQVFGAGLSSVCSLGGDFDIQVDFNLLVWPQSSGVRVGLSLQDAPVPIPAVERTGFVPIDFPSLPREVYLTDFGDGVQGVANSDLTGTLRVTRTSTTFNGYYLSSGNWILIHSGPAANTGDLHFGLRAWSHNQVFGNQNVTVAFDNFVLNTGRLDCPRLTLTPNSGVLGTQVQVQGSGFPTSQYGPIQVLVSFDNQFLGIATNENGTFAFVFNVPHADPTKPHFVHGVEPYPVNLDVQAAFTVLPEPTPNSLSLVVETGSTYFPGDSVTIYILTTENGVPVEPSGVKLQVSITRPNGTSSALNPVPVGIGLYKASFTVPKTGSLGTYAIIATASVNGLQAASLDTFEVQPAWVSRGGPTILSVLSLPDTMPTVAIVGMIIAGVAVLGLAFLTRRVSK